MDAPIIIMPRILGKAVPKTSSCFIKTARTLFGNDVKNENVYSGNGSR